MDPELEARYQARAKIMKAMSHPTRLFIVDEVAKGERCVCELTEIIGDHISTVSKHLAVLKNAGILSSHKNGSHMLYQLRVPCAVDFLDCVERVLKAVASRHNEVLEGR